MTFLKEECRFAFVANRFRWEDANREKPLEGNIIYERVNCGICFDTVTAVRHNGLNQAKKAQIISLLSIVAEEEFIDLAFSAGITVRLQVEKILCHLQDLDEPWPTQKRPSCRSRSLHPCSRACPAAMQACSPGTRRSRSAPAARQTRRRRAHPAPPSP